MRHDRPLLQLVDQHFSESAPVDVGTAVAAGFERADVHALVTRGDRIAITAGSRGIRDLPAVLRATVAAVREAGGDPFIAPCMGSHGGATAEGQRATLQSLGVTEQTVGAPVVSSMDVVRWARAPSACRSGRRETWLRPTASWSSTASSRTPTSTERSRAAS